MQKAGKTFVCARGFMSGQYILVPFIYRLITCEHDY